MKHKPPQTPKEYLDQRKQELTQKHHQRLQEMSNLAIQTRQKGWRYILFKPAMATALTVFSVTVFVFLHEPEKQPDPTLLTALPVWVTDTDVPVTLIENLEFYDWLVQQTENQNAKSQKYFTVALNEYDQYRFSQRLTTRNLTQRVSGTAAYLRTIQR